MALTPSFPPFREAGRQCTAHLLYFKDPETLLRFAEERKRENETAAFKSVVTMSDKTDDG